METYFIGYFVEYTFFKDKLFNYIYISRIIFEIASYNSFYIVFFYRINKCNIITSEISNDHSFADRIYHMKISQIISIYKFIGVTISFIIFCHNTNLIYLANDYYVLIYSKLVFYYPKCLNITELCTYWFENFLDHGNYDNYLLFDKNKIVCKTILTLKYVNYNLLLIKLIIMYYHHEFG